MPKRFNSDDEDNVASNASSGSNDDSDDSDNQVETKNQYKKARVDSDSDDSGKSQESSDESSGDEVQDKKKDSSDEEEEEEEVNKNKKNVFNDSSDEEKSDNEKVKEKSDDEKSVENKSDDERSEDDKSDDDKSDDDKSDDEESNDAKSGEEKSDDEIKVAKKKYKVEKSDDEKSVDMKSNEEKSDDEKSEKQKSDEEKSEADDSDSDEKSNDDSSPKKKILNAFNDSDDESDTEKKSKKNKDLEDIFGDISDEEDEEKQKIKQEQNKERENRHMYHLEDEEEEEVIPETRIDVTIPRIVADLGKEIHFVKLPNFLSVDTHPYDQSWYEDEIDEDEICDEEGRARMKLKVENTIRWRNSVDKDNNMIKESNARIVKWSDGSMSLHLGSEIFDIHKQNLLQGDNNHLYIRQGTGLQGQAVFRTKLTFRPHSTDSFTHKKMTLSLADRSQKTQKIRVLPTVGLDPEANRNEMIKKEEDRLRASLRRENKARRVRERVNQRGPTASYLEPDMDDDDENTISLSAIKNKYKQRGQSYNDVYSDSDSEGSNDSIFNKKKTSAVKKTGRIEESDEEE